jgi:hypothetical protein
MIRSRLAGKSGFNVHTLLVAVLVMIAAACMPVFALGQDAKDDCPEGYERLPDAKECTPIEWDGPVIDPGLIETPGPDLPDPILVLPTPVPTLPDPVTPRADETPPAPTQAPRAFASITIEGFTCPRWHIPDYTNGLIPPCGPMPGLTLSIISDGVLIASGVTEGSKESAQVTFFEVPAGKIEVVQKPIPGAEAIQVFCGDGGSASAVPMATKSSVVVEVLPGKHLTCSFVNVTAK